MHDRPIHTRCDDSVARMFPATRNELTKGEKPVFYPLRRARGYAPDPVRLAVRSPAAAGSRRRAEEYLLPDARALRLPQPPYRRSGKLRDAALLRAGHRAFRAPVPHPARSASPTTCTRTTWRPAMPWSGPSGKACPPSACSTTMPTSPPAWQRTG